MTITHTHFTGLRELQATIAEMTRALETVTAQRDALARRVDELEAERYRRPLLLIDRGLDGDGCGYHVEVGE